MHAGQINEVRNISRIVTWKTIFESWRYGPVCHWVDFLYRLTVTVLILSSYQPYDCSCFQKYYVENLSWRAFVAPEFPVGGLCLLLIHGRTTHSTKCVVCLRPIHLAGKALRGQRDRLCTMYKHTEKHLQRPCPSPQYTQALLSWRDLSRDLGNPCRRWQQLWPTQSAAHRPCYCNRLLIRPFQSCALAQLQVAGHNTSGVPYK